MFSVNSVAKSKEKKMVEKIFLNDKLVDVGQACVSVADSGFLYGAGLFETMRACNGVVFELDGHIDRLFGSAEALFITNTYDKSFVKDAIYKTLDANKLTEARMRLTLSGGSVSALQEQAVSTLVITATEFQAYPAELYEKGVLAVLSGYRQNPNDPVYGHKTLSYLARIKALELARRKQATEALWFTTDGRLAEGCISNVFIVKDSVVYTPKLDTPILAGIARKTVCRIAKEKGIELVEKDLSIDDVLKADEIFLTNVIMQVLPIANLEQHTYGDGKAGSVTKKLRKYFDEFVKKACEQRK